MNARLTFWVLNQDPDFNLKKEMDFFLNQHSFKVPRPLVIFRSVEEVEGVVVGDAINIKAKVQLR